MVYKVITEIVDKMEPIDLNGDLIKINFGYGNKLDLFKHLESVSSHKPKVFTDEQGRQVYLDKYPLIWLVTPLKVTNTNSYYDKVVDNAVFLIAHSNSNQSMNNKARRDRTFSKCIEPLFESFKWDLLRDGRTKLDRSDIDEIDHFNYAFGESKKIGDIWDVKEVTLDLKITSKGCRN